MRPVVQVSSYLSMSQNTHIKVTKRADLEKQAEEERRLEIRFLRHLKKKYSEEDKKITDEILHWRDSTSQVEK